MNRSASPVDAAAAVETASARWLRISILRNGRPVVQVSFPAYAVLNLPDLVPDEVRPHLLAQSIDLEGLGAMTAARGCPPGEIFSVPGDSHVVRAWLE
ncbi:MAG TPA: hypothetical protein VIL35_06650 [Vicinamibacterales bacterium]